MIAIFYLIVFFLQGFDPSSIGNDEVFYLNSKENRYVKITPEIFSDIMSSKLRF